MINIKIHDKCMHAFIPSDLMDYIRREACLNLRCDPLATRHNSYRSYYIHASPRHHALLLKPGMWPKDVIVKKFTTNGHK